MIRVLNWEDLQNGPLYKGNTAVTIGVFDGVHRGHQALLARISARSPALIPTVVTFKKSPKENASYRGDISSFDEKCALFEEAGVEFCVIIDFSKNFSRMSGRDFVNSLKVYLSCAYAAVGDNFYCGFRRDTGAEAFKALAKERGIEVEIQNRVLEGGKPVSSSRIRECIEAGRFEDAHLLLGRKLTRRALYIH
ncbi:MAG: FAD synthetase family protein [Treponema sp.]|jgi:riboflavin kinase/FMN adenylyltransferase|nr:FAD synthetase family protein [Treponema sp.]